MPPMRRALAIAAAGLVAACSATRPGYDRCATSSDCRRAFGPGSSCGPDGLCALAPLPAHCPETYPEDLWTNRELRAVVFGSLTNRAVETHRARERAVRLAAKQVAKQGGLQGRTLGVVFCRVDEDKSLDSLTREQAAVQAATYLAATAGAPAIVGPAASSDVQAVFQAVRQHETLIISPSATSEALTGLDPPAASDQSPGLLWRTAAPDSLQGSAIAADLRGPGKRRASTVARVALLHETGAYGEGLAKVFAAAFKAAGGEKAELYPFPSATALGDAIAKVAASDAEEVIFASSQVADAIAFMNSAATQQGLASKRLFLTDSAANKDLLEKANPARFASVRGSRPAPLDDKGDPGYSTFIAAYQAEYGVDVRPYSYVPHAYDAAWLVFYGAAWAELREGAISGRNIARGLRRMSSGAALEIRELNWNPVVELFRTGKSINVRGTSGDLDYDPLTEETSAPIEIWVIEGGAIVGVDTWLPPR
jgi:branched-chain amino acid transport system substrate-binding protein